VVHIITNVVVHIMTNLVVHIITNLVVRIMTNLVVHIMTVGFYIVDIFSSNLPFMRFDTVCLFHSTSR